jgi:hypothetical protein
MDLNSSDSAAPEAKTTVVPLVAVKSTSLSSTPFKNTSMYPGKYPPDGVNVVCPAVATASVIVRTV